MDRAASIPSLKRAWTDLAFRTRNIFGTWEWASTWWDHLGRTGSLALFTFQADGEIVAIVPLFLSSAGGVRVLRLVGQGPADDFGPVCDPDYSALSPSFLWRALEEFPARWDVFLGEHFVGNIAWERIPGARSIRRASSPVIRTNGGWSDFLKFQSANMRRQYGRYERALREKYKVEYRRADDPERLPEDLDALFALHAARWGGRSSGFSTLESFHREFAACALIRGWLRLWFMELDGRAVAAWYGFRFGGEEFAYQAGRDPSLESSSVGTLLLLHTIKEAFNDGVETYRFLRGGEPYKSRFATEDLGVETFAVARGPLGRAVLRTAMAVDRFRPLGDFAKKWVAE